MQAFGGYRRGWNGSFTAAIFCPENGRCVRGFYSSSPDTIISNVSSFVKYFFDILSYFFQYFQGFFAVFGLNTSSQKNSPKTTPERAAYDRRGYQYQQQRRRQQQRRDIGKARQAPRHDRLQGDTIRGRGTGYVNVCQSGTCARHATPPPQSIPPPGKKTIKAYASTGPVPRVDQSPAQKAPARADIPVLLFSFYSFLFILFFYSF